MSKLALILCLVILYFTIDEALSETSALLEDKNSGSLKQGMVRTIISHYIDKERRRRRSAEARRPFGGRQRSIGSNSVRFRG